MWSSWRTWKVAGHVPPPMSGWTGEPPPEGWAPVRATENDCRGVDRLNVAVEIVICQPPPSRPSKSSRNWRNRSAAAAQVSVDGVLTVIW